MKTKKNQKRLEVKKGIDLTPMVDVLFLLIIFFLISFSKSEKEVFKVNLPNANIAEKLDEEFPLLFVKANGEILYKNEVIPPYSLKNFLKTQILSEKNEKIIIAGDQETPYQKIIDLMSLAKETGIEKVALRVDTKE